MGLAALAPCLVIDYRIARAALAARLRGCWSLALISVPSSASRAAARGAGFRSAGFSLQPSEFARLAVALVLAMFYGESRRSAKSLGELVVGGVLMACPPPDSQAARSGHRRYARSCLSRRRLPGRPAAAVAGDRRASSLALLSPVVWQFGMKDYQRTRVVDVLRPGKDPRGPGTSRFRPR